MHSPFIPRLITAWPFASASPAALPTPLRPSQLPSYLRITTVLKLHGFRVTGVGLEICSLTPVAAEPRQPYKPGMSALPLPKATGRSAEVLSLLKCNLLTPFSASLYVEARSNPPPRRLFWDLNVMACFLTFFGSLPSQEGLLDHSRVKPNPSLLSIGIFLPCFLLLLFLLRSPLNLLLCTSSYTLWSCPFFSGFPGHLASPFTHRKLSPFWATWLLEETNDKNSKIRNPDNGKVHKL